MRGPAAWGEGPRPPFHHCSPLWAHGLPSPACGVGDGPDGHFTRLAQGSGGKAEGAGAGAPHAVLLALELGTPFQWGDVKPGSGTGAVKAGNKGHT